MRRSRRTTFLVLLGVAALLCASMLAPAFGAPQATSAASLAKKLAQTLKIAKRADRNAKRAIAGLQVEGAPGQGGSTGPAGQPGAQGPPGVPGAKGDKGDAGVSAPRLWAIVNSAGTAHGAGVTSGTNLFTGGYEVVFNRDVSACGYQVTRSDTPGEVIAQPRSGKPNGVFIGTYTSAGAAGNTGFHVAVFC
jgi:hypothetical protein